MSELPIDQWCAADVARHQASHTHLRTIRDAEETNARTYESCTLTAPIIAGYDGGTHLASGAGEPGDRVACKVDSGSFSGNALVGADGTWSLDVGAVASTHTITARATNANGNQTVGAPFTVS